MTMEELLIYGALGALIAIALWLATKSWFWIFTLLGGALAAFLACIASIMNFQILAAIGFIFLSAMLIMAANSIAS